AVHRRRGDPLGRSRRPSGLGAAEGGGRASPAGTAGRMSGLTIMSFAYSRGDPPEANLLFDMRFLRNPHWQDDLRALSGLDAPVGAYIAGDEAYDDALARIEALLLALLPLYLADGKAFVRIAFGCTGGRHRSVHV